MSVSSQLLPRVLSGHIQGVGQEGTKGSRAPTPPPPKFLSNENKCVFSKRTNKDLVVLDGEVTRELVAQPT